MKRAIVLTGGGTAGHVIPHIAMLPYFRKAGWSILYVGSSGIEKDLIGQQVDVNYHQVAAGKLRRYFSWQNFGDFFKVWLGLWQSLFILARTRPSVVFSKGGFVSVPVAIAAWLLRIPVVSHESDLTPGLANRIISRFASLVLYAFPETSRYLGRTPKKWVGIPVRSELFAGDKNSGLDICQFEDVTKPVVLFMGGSLGAQKLNEAVRKSFSCLTKKFNVIHLTGKGKGLNLERNGSYVAFEYIGEGLEHLLAAADLVVARAGANSLFELLALNKPMLLVPLQVGSRGDQLDNAKSFAKQNWARVLYEAFLDEVSLVKALGELAEEKAEIMKSQQNAFGSLNSQNEIFSALEPYIRSGFGKE